MTPCEICGDRYDEERGDGYNGLCPSCADSTDALIEAGVDENVARDIWRQMQPTTLERAAPDLLAALEMIMADTDAMSVVSPDAWTNGDAAIAKARGQ